MITTIPLLQSVKVASPCSAAWDGMDTVDGDRVHFCGECKKNVYNLSAMSQAEAEGLLRRHEGHLCVRYFKRTDGTVLTTDCPVGAQAVRLMFIRRNVTVAVLMLVSLSGLAMYEATATLGSPRPSAGFVTGMSANSPTDGYGASQGDIAAKSGRVREVQKALAKHSEAGETYIQVEPSDTENAPAEHTSSSPQWTVGQIASPHDDYHADAQADKKSADDKDTTHE